MKISWYGKHFGEEPPLVGDKSQGEALSLSKGAGGIFFTGCNLHCVFCQNYQISQEWLGKDYSAEQLADIMLELQDQGAINIDLVTPTIWHKEIKPAIILAKKKGLKIPILWNSNAYEPLEILQEMNGLIDIYLPDFKYGLDEIGFKYSKIKNYPAVAKKAVQEMFNQVQYLITDKNNLAKKGIIVRHLILPNNLENSFKALDILSNINKNIHLSLMNQYFPVYKASQFPELKHPLSANEFDAVYDHLDELGFENGWIQDKESREIMIPDFKKENPFT